MIYIFYDFETSSRDPLGQILSYSFIAVNTAYDVIRELTGLVKVNRTQIPDVDAILTNKLNIDELNQYGQSDLETAHLIYHFINDLLTQYGECTLAGFNTNQFDLTFLRNLLIGYGFNPYFKGKLHNKDVLHFAQHLAFTHPQSFPWVRTENKQTSQQYYSFKLEDLANELGLLSETQSHNAREDVILTIQLTRLLEAMFKSSFITFQPTLLYQTPLYQEKFEVGKQKTRHFTTLDQPLLKVDYNYFMKLATVGKAYLVINLKQWQEMKSLPHTTTSDKLSCIRYINPNKAFFILEPLSEDERSQYDSLIQTASEDAYFKTLQLSPNQYFNDSKKEWDIAYQIHEMGFERIETLRSLVTRLISDPSTYEATLQQLLKSKHNIKDRYMLQLYNRAYLNHHPSPNPHYLKKYMHPRYETGSLLRDHSQFTPIHKQYQRIEALLLEATLPEQDLINLSALKTHIEKNLEPRFNAIK